jgi:uncharacterized protein (TIGR03437 family)
MRLKCVAAAVSILAEALAQMPPAPVATTPPTPDAILVAGTSPAVNLATDVALTPRSLALAPDGTLYLTDAIQVWRVDTAGVLSAVPGPWEAPTQGLPNIGLPNIPAIAADASGNLFIAGWLQHQIWKLTPQGAITTIAGLGSQFPDGSGPVPANSVATVATSLAVDLQSNVFFSDAVRVWKISPDGLLRPFAGTGQDGVPQPTAGPVPALQYGLIGPGRLAADRAGNVYINDASGVDRVTPDGMLSQIRLASSPIVTSLAVDGSGNLYGGLIDDYYAGQVARIAADGSLQILAGTGAPGSSDGCTAAAPGVPQAIYATLNWPTDLAADSAGNLYFADPTAGLVRTVTRDGQIHTVAGGPGGTFGGDGGPAAEAFLSGPTALALDSIGNLYFIDRNNNRVRRIDPSGIIQTVAGSGPTAGQDPACIAPGGMALSQPGGLAVDPDGNVYIGDTGNNRVLKLATDGSLAQIAGTGDAGSGGDGGPATDAQLNAPTGLAFGFGSLYIAEMDRIRYITANGTIDTFYAPLVVYPTSLALDAAGNVFVANGGLVELAAGGHVFVLPGDGSGALATGPMGEVYFSDGGGSLSRLDHDCTVTPLTGSANELRGIAVAPGGDLYVSDFAANRIWRIPARAPGGGSVPISLAPAGIVNGATLRPREVLVQPASMFGPPFPVYAAENENPAPGEIVAISGTCLGPLQFTQGNTDSSGRVATAIGDIQVFFNGVAAPLLSAAPNQLFAVVPYEMAGASSAAAQVQYHGQSAGVSLNPSVTSVGIFPVANATYARGSTVSLSITGAGQTNPPGVTGQVAGNPAPQPVAQVQVTVGGVAAEVLSAAADPGTIGVTRIAFRIPPGLNPGPTGITVAVGASSDSISAVLN